MRGTPTHLSAGDGVSSNVNCRQTCMQDEETRPSSSVIIVAQRVASMRPQIALLPEAGALPRLEPRLGPHLARLGVWRGRGLFSFFLVTPLARIIKRSISTLVGSSSTRVVILRALLRFGVWLRFAGPLPRRLC